MGGGGFCGPTLSSGSAGRLLKDAPKGDEQKPEAEHIRVKNDL
jgi:hypothetical protein